MEILKKLMWAENKILFAHFSIDIYKKLCYNTIKQNNKEENIYVYMEK